MSARGPVPLRHVVLGTASLRPFPGIRATGTRRPALFLH
ncbi:hypothetical protein CKAH01_00910 [Colletotrichum kahawae]|uniref:Uncharacterized protein n=1 Tax=Colletotrichum kahawae TaxID=34407 RepID=A0AAD9YHV3_COLKA|nr:hypothetical protein CKAH01_00910 [Colletotrichum kahawae]